MLQAIFLVRDKQFQLDGPFTRSFDLQGAKAERIGPFVSFVWPDVPKALHGFSVPVHRDERNTPLPLPATVAL